MRTADASKLPVGVDTPARLGEHRILRRLATGGTSDVFLACKEGPGGFERVVVLKVLLRPFQDDHRFERMFFREAAAYGRLSHPAIVRLYDFFEDDRRLVLVLEHVDGVALNRLHALVRRAGQRMDDAAALFIGWRLCSALAAAHAAKDSFTGAFGPVIHRDINPSNVLVPWDGYVKLADFGTASVSGLGGDAPLGPLKGTFGYVAPEQARGDLVTVRADVYVACVVLWELLTGRRAMTRSGRPDGDLATAMAVPSFPALATLRPDLPRVLLDAIACSLSTNPDSRVLAAEDMCNVLRTVADLDDGRRSLVETLARLRPTEEELAVTHSQSNTVITPGPAPVAESMAPSHRPVSLSGAASPRPTGALVRLTAVLCALAVCAAVVLRVWSRAQSAGPAQGAASPAAALEAAALEAAALEAAAGEGGPAVAAPAVSANPAEPRDATSGTISVPTSRIGHRVWIDERVVGEAPGRYVVTCGVHSVRVGSQGESHQVTVPCDVDVSVQ